MWRSGRRGGECGRFLCGSVDSGLVSGRRVVACFPAFRVWLKS